MPLAKFKIFLCIKEVSFSPYSRGLVLKVHIPKFVRAGIGMAVDRVWSGYPRILGMSIVGLVQIFTHGFADLDIRNTVGLGRILHVARGPLELRKLIPINPHKEF
jgi:hypothetical protein